MNKAERKRAKTTLINQVTELLMWMNEIDYKLDNKLKTEK